jgi:hypothetical protein
MSRKESTMKTKVIPLGLSVVVLVNATVARADAPAPPTPPNGSVYAGNCVSPALNATVRDKSKYEVGFLAGVVSSVGTALLGQAFDWVGTQLAKLGADQQTAVAGARTSEAVFNDHYCVQILRYADNGKTLNTLEPPGWSQAKQQTPAAPLGRKLDFFAEFWVRPSTDGGAVSLTPTLLYYPAYLNDSGTNKAAQFVQVSLGGSGSDAASVTWALPSGTKPDSTKLQVLLTPDTPVGGTINRFTPKQLSAGCESACEGSSAWITNPWKDAKIEPVTPPVPAKAEAAPAPETKPAANAGDKSDKKTKTPPFKAVEATPPGAAAAASAAGTTDYGGANYAIKPVNIQLSWSEVRDGSAFWKTVAGLFNTQKPTLEAQAGQVLFADQKEKAKIDAMTASSTALTTFATTIADAETQRTMTYCPAEAIAKTNWIALSAALRAKQLSANVAAAAAGQPLPFNPVAVSSKFDPTICPG